MADVRLNCSWTAAEHTVSTKVTDVRKRSFEDYGRTCIKALEKLKEHHRTFLQYRIVHRRAL